MDVLAISISSLKQITLLKVCVRRVVLSFSSVISFLSPVASSDNNAFSLVINTMPMLPFFSTPKAACTISTKARLTYSYARTWDFEKLHLLHS